MSIKASMRAYGRDLLYITIIGLMGIRMYREHVHHQLFLDTMYSQMEVWGIDNASRYNCYVYNIVEKSGYYYYQKNKKYLNQLDSVFTTCNTIQKQVENLSAHIGVKPGDRPYQFTRKINPQEWNAVQYSMKRYYDTLCVITDRDSQIYKNLLVPTPEDRFWALVDVAGSDETGILLQLLKGRIINACINGINDLGRSKITEPMCGFSRYCPVMLEYGKAIRPGEEYEADFFLAKIPNDENNLQVRVNGRELPVDQGLAHYRKRFDTTGEKRLSLQILLRNPVTQYVESFSKDFWVVVLDSCVQKNYPNNK